MEALVLAVGLRMPRPSMDEPDPELDEPDAQDRQPIVALHGAPRRTVVAADGGWQAIGLEAADQRRLNVLQRLAGTGPQQHIEAGMVIEHGQGMATTVGHGDMAFEVHLPQRVGVRVLETLPRSGSL